MTRFASLPKWAERLFTLLSKRIVLLLLIFVVWVGLFDANSVVNIFSARRRVHELKEKKSYYQRQIAEEQRRLQELHTNRRNLEKFAREQYFMRKANEDIYVVVE